MHFDPISSYSTGEPTHNKYHWVRKAEMRKAEMRKAEMREAEVWEAEVREAEGG